MNERKHKIFCPSMMCADYSNLRDDVKKLEAGGADALHCDIMDGNFVPNFGMGRQDFECVRRETKIKIDAHLMTENPDRHAELFAGLGADIIYIHPEADRHAARTLQHITDLGALPGIALNPGTAAEAAEPLLYLSEYVLCMTVNPGYYGQKFLRFVIPKIKKLADWKDKYNFRLFIDGGATPEIIKELSELGVDGFILGTTLFNDEDYEKRLEFLRSV